MVRWQHGGRQRGCIPAHVLQPGVPGVPVPPRGRWGVLELPMSVGVGAVGFSRGQSRFSGTGWSGLSWSVVGVVANPRATCPFTVPLRPPPGGVRLSLSTPGGGRGVTAAPPAPMQLRPPSCCSCCPRAAPPGCGPPPKLSSPASSRCFLGFGSGCAHNIFSPVPAAFCARVPRGGGCGGGRVEESPGREEEEVAEGSPEVSSCFWEHP